MKSKLMLLFTMLIAIFAISSAQATVRRAPGSMLFGPTAVWTNNTTVDVFFPLSEPMSSGGINAVRYMQELQQSTGNCEIKTALRYGNDGVAWDSPQAVASGYRASNGLDSPGGYVDIVTGFTQKPWVQFGVFVRNVNSGSAFELCNATIQIEPKRTPN